jgi:broad specificity phosphatase PhoE
VPLDAVGIAQAEALGRRLGGEPYDLIVSSDLERARLTAGAIARGRPVEIDARWREMMMGEWEGLVWSEIAERFPEAAGRPNAGGRFVTPRGGESFAALETRVGAALWDLRTRFPGGGRVLVATHAGVLHALLALTLGEAEAEARRVRFLPASFTRLALAPDGVRIVALNQSAGESEVA